MIPWLLVVELLSRSGKKLSQLVGERIQAYPCSGEINYRVTDAKVCIQKIQDHFSPMCLKQEDIDGLSMEFADWRFNLRMSNTEPLLRLNVEARGDAALVKLRLNEIEEMIKVPTQC
jgi:phosphomannomutase